MILQANHFNSALVLSIVFAAVMHACPVQAQEIYYFGDRARDLEVSAESETMLSFPVSPFARVCQPAGIIELYPIEDSNELDSFLVPRGIQSPQFSGLPSGGGSSTATSGHGGGSELAARHLKLVPKRMVGTTTCAIRLTNEQVVNVRVTLSKLVNKPIVEFRSGMEKAKAGAVLSEALGPINLFRAFVTGGDITFLADETPITSSSSKTGDSGQSHGLKRSTDLAAYTLVFVGSDEELYKLWRFEGTAARDFTAPQALKGAKVGEFYYSAFRSLTGPPLTKEQADPRPLFRKGQAFAFLVLSRSDISAAEMLEKLP